MPRPVETQEQIVARLERKWVRRRARQIVLDKITNALLLAGVLALPIVLAASIIYFHAH